MLLTVQAHQSLPAVLLPASEVPSPTMQGIAVPGAGLAFVLGECQEIPVDSFA